MADANPLVKVLWVLEEKRTCLCLVCVCSSRGAQCGVGAGGKQPEQRMFPQSLPAAPATGRCWFSTLKAAPAAGNDAEPGNREQPGGNHCAVVAGFESAGSN